MKKIYYKTIGAFMIVAVFSGSCSKDILNKNPTDQLSAGTFFTSANSIGMALTGCYGTLQDMIFTTANPIYDCMADNGYNFNNYNSTTTLSQGPITPTSGGYIDLVYSGSYAKIARYNQFLKTLAAYNQSDLDATTKSVYEAEVRLMRAMKYFDLYKFYGSVPLVLEPLTLANQYQPKADSGKVLAQINADIDFAIANLPDVSYASNDGHLVKDAAETLKARVLLYGGYNADGSAKADVMAQAAAVTADIIGKNHYKIAPSFRGLFCNDIGQQNGNPEYIFSVNYLAPNDLPTSFWGWGQAQVFTADAGSPGGALLPLANFANEFEFIDGTPFSTSNPLYNPNNVYQNRDPRMAKTLFSDTTTFENGFFLKILPSPTGYSYKKHIEGTDAQNIYGNLNSSDWPAMRYAEVLLMYAEAENEAVGPTPDVYSAIDQIRSRADVLMPDLPAGLSQVQMRAAIRHERRIELAFEGFRYDDLKRWRIATTVLNMPASESIISKTFVQKNYLLPLPQSEIDINKGVLVQNPDYQ